MKRVMAATEIMEIVPDRYPARYIGYVDEITPDGKTIATKSVTINKEFFQGHFPGNLTMPGVLIIEALMQIGSTLVLKVDQFEGETAHIGGINKTKFHQEMAPGDALRPHFEIARPRDFVDIGEATAYMEDKKVCECELTLIMGR